MFKSYVLFSLALGGLVLAGCNKDENPPVTPTPPATTSAPATTEPAAPTPTPTPAPATTSAPSAAVNSVQPAVAEIEKKANDIANTVAKNVPTTNPIAEANK